GTTNAPWRRRPGPGRWRWAHRARNGWNNSFPHHGRALFRVEAGPPIQGQECRTRACRPGWPGRARPWGPVLPALRIAAGQAAVAALGLDEAGLAAARAEAGPRPFHRQGVGVQHARQAGLALAHEADLHHVALDHLAD